MHAWRVFIATPGVDSLTYSDDRTLILRPQRGPVDCQPLRRVSQKSRAFDHALGLKCDSTKSTVVGLEAFEGLARDLGYSRVTSLGLLGIEHPVDAAVPRTLTKLAMAVVHARPPDSTTWFRPPEMPRSASSGSPPSVGVLQ